MHSGGQKKARNDSRRANSGVQLVRFSSRRTNFQEVDDLMNIDFSTLCLISVPGFLIGLMVGRFVFGSPFREFKKRLGVLGRLLGGAVFSVYLAATAITLGIMVIYLVNFPETAKPANFWVIMLFAVWIVLNFIYDFRRIFRPADATRASS